MKKEIEKKYLEFMKNNKIDMNKERILQLADAIENQSIWLSTEKVNFNIYEWFIEDECGTFACIAGSAVILFNPEKAKIWKNDKCFHSWSKEAQNLLGLGSTTKDYLFTPYLIPHYSVGDIDKNVVAKVLRNLAKTGKVEWEKFLPVKLTNDMPIGAKVTYLKKILKIFTKNKKLIP